MKGMDFNPNNIKIPEAVFDAPLQEEMGFPIDIETILTNKKVITTFFSKNRDTWYTALLNPTPTDGDRISLDSQQNLDLDSGDEYKDSQLAKGIALFFEQNPGAKAAFLEYISEESK